MVLLFYSTYISVDIAHHEIFCAKVGKGGIKVQNQFLSIDIQLHCVLLAYIQPVLCQ